MTGRDDVADLLALPAETLAAYAAGFDHGYERGLLAASAAQREDWLPFRDWPEDPGPVPSCWEHAPGRGVPAEWLPPDLTAGRLWDPFGEVLCPEVWRGWECTRRAGHGGRHAAGVAGSVVAVWRTAFDVPDAEQLAALDDDPPAADGTVPGLLEDDPRPQEVCS